jgi:uncharacterized protein YqjF (DUF2071 family)
MRQRWTDLVFLHWKYDADEVARHLPRELEVDTFQGDAWVSMTPFVLTVLPLIGPRIFEAPETNVRTYVRHRGRSGIWFFSLDLGNVAGAGGARLTYGLPYYWSDMSVDRRPRSIVYRSRRIWPATGAGHDVSVRVGKFVDRDTLGDLARFLTARWRLYVKRGPVLLEAPVEHPAFDFARIEVTRMRQSLLAAAGLPAPTEPPLAHFTPGVEVKVGPPRPAT